ncbi:phage terminase large subunit family protein [Paenibacillus kribbensis]|uniref:phage terminase large subunit family protein n=1 Tax=Paenibacillus kribbensis TaxID=172713 RepID=UPI002DC0016B|nr:terminase gpA endonuclease subunit [Paenibacillus kribbensis]MEC0234064.1 phage terminase large subunit family protein [Paenibacillus kribbensis]
MPKKAASKWADWLAEALSVLRPPEKLTVSDWADKYRLLDSKTSAEPGQWSTDRTPYLRGIMDSFTDPRVEEIIFLKPTQVGGTECLNNMLGYVIAQDPNPALVVYPIDTLAQFTSENRLQPMIELSPALRSRYHANRSKDLELQFDGMYAVIAGANSPASLSSRPARYLFMDEVDKYPRTAGKEADPRALARERTKTFPHNKKIMQTSTPTVRSGPIWRAWEAADIKLQYYVPCPHCGQYQTLKFAGGSGHIKFDSKQDLETIRETAYYECAHCRGAIRDAHKPAMLRAGEWRTPDGLTGRKRKTGFWLNALYSPWVRFGDAAVEFLTSKRAGPEELMNFINSWLAEPWENTQIKLNSDKVLEKDSGYEEGVVPDKTILLTGGVDVQKDRFYYTIRAWGEGMSSQNIRHGVVETWAQIEDVMNISYCARDGTEYFVNLCAIDSGYNADDTYTFCVNNSEWAVAVKGSNTALPSKFKLSKIDREERGMYGISLYHVDGGYYKDFISNRMVRKNDEPGGWFVYTGCDLEYAEQVTAEEKVIEKRGRNDYEVWRPKTAHADNHYLDTEVYAAFAADCLGIRYMRFEEKPEPKKEVSTKPAKQNSWVGGGNGSWL